jgi:hypothetical protein
MRRRLHDKRQPHQPAPAPGALTSRLIAGTSRGVGEYGPTLGRPLVDTLTGSKIANLKELRPRQTMIRLLFVFDPWRSAILLTGGDKTGQWETWYERAIPHAEELYAFYLKERAEEEGQ